MVLERHNRRLDQMAQSQKRRMTFELCRFALANEEFVSRAFTPGERREIASGKLARQAKIEVTRERAFLERRDDDMTGRCRAHPVQALQRGSTSRSRGARPAAQFSNMSSQARSM